MSEYNKIEWDFAHFTNYDFKVIKDIVDNYETIRENYLNQGIILYYIKLAYKEFDLNNIKDKYDLAYNYILPFTINLNLHFCTTQDELSLLIEEILNKNLRYCLSNKYLKYIENKKVINAPKIFEQYIETLDIFED